MYMYHLLYLVSTPQTVYRYNISIFYIYRTICLTIRIVQPTQLASQSKSEIEVKLICNGRVV